MGMDLPGELRSLLAMLGYNWPEGDETRLFQMGGSWVGFDGGFRQPLATADGHAQNVLAANQGDGIDAFRASWNEAESARTNLADGSTAATLIGSGLYICAGIVLALKINVIIQLITLAIQIAQAIATAVVTFGASLLEIPIFKMITGFLIDQLLNLAFTAVLGG